MATEAPEAPTQDAPLPTPSADTAAPAAPATAAPPTSKPPVRRSWRRKFRKMRIRFDDAMSQSSALIVDEWKAMGTARRLQAENDQLLDALLDFNNQPRVPARRRFDLTDASVLALAHAPAAIPTADSDHHTHLQKTLAQLEATVPHTTLADLPALPRGIDLSDNAPGYMSPQHEDDYLLALDHHLQDASFEEDTRHYRNLHLGPPQPPLSEKDLTIRNPDSVYNWLRKNQPQVFLQDKDALHHDNVSEKAAPKATTKKSRPSNMGGGGTPGPKDDHDAEDSAAPEGKSKSKKGAADPDDTAYRPKGGSSRPAKRKRDVGDGETKNARKKNRPSAAANAAAAAATATATATPPTG